ncbi:MAG TPA: chemotaxis protein CheD [Methylomirabilota bacterium]|nr:chemotaxis protein CheD [Methylomirabilota bacterium]
MNEKIVVNTSGFAIGIAPQVLVTQGIGSCVAICLYEKKQKIGALLHIMLPHAESDKLNPLRFADTALSFIIIELEKKGVSKEGLSVKLVGGAHMFATFDSKSDIGTKNGLAIKKILADMRIIIESEDLGGAVGRSLEFDLLSGLVKIFTR